MKLYEDKEKARLIKTMLHSESEFTFSLLKQFREDGILEDYDLFKVSSDMFDDMLAYYLDGKYYMVTSNHRYSREIPEELLSGRTFTMAIRSITNNVQGFLQRKGTEAFAALNDEERLEIILGSHYKPAERIALKDLDIDER